MGIQAKKVPLLTTKTPFGKNLLIFCKNITKIFDMVACGGKIVIMYDFYITYFINKTRSMAGLPSGKRVYRYPMINTRSHIGQGDENETNS